MTKQEARSSAVIGAAAASTAEAAVVEEDGTERSIQRTASLPMTGTSLPANVEPVPIFFERSRSSEAMQNPSASEVVFGVLRLGAKM